MKSIYIFSAGSAGRETLNLIKNINVIKKTWKVISFVDKSKILQKKKIDGFKVIDPSKIKKVKNIYAICGVMDPNTRLKIYRDEILNKKLKVPNLIHPDTNISNFSKIGKGNIIFNNVHISYDVKIKNYSIVSNFVDLGHNAKAEDYLTIMPSAVIGGSCIIGNKVLIGSNATILQNLKIGNNNLIGSNSLITKSTKNNQSIVNYQRQIVSKRINN